MDLNQQNPTTMINPMLMAETAKVGLVNRLFRMWHIWNVDSLTLDLRVQTARCDLLKIAEREYRSSYYTDHFHEAVCRRIDIASKLEYHKSRLFS